MWSQCCPAGMEPGEEPDGEECRAGTECPEPGAGGEPGEYNSLCVGLCYSEEHTWCV